MSTRLHPMKTCWKRTWGLFIADLHDNVYYQDRSEIMECSQGRRGLEHFSSLVVLVAKNSVVDLSYLI